MKFLPDSINFGAVNDCSDKKTLKLYHRHYEEKANGEKKTIERSAEYLKSTFAQGDGWFNTVQPNWVDKDREEDHFRNDKNVLIVRDVITIEDKEGNKTIDEKVKRTEDEKTSHGKKLIGHGSDHRPDERIEILEEFLIENQHF